MKVFVAGANGFLGKQLTKNLIQNEFEVTGSVRVNDDLTIVCNKIVVIGDIDGETLWNSVLEDQKVVIHLANRAHIMNEVVQDPLLEFRSVNVDGTLNLARQAIDAGVQRFIFISSIKVNGEGDANRVYRFDDPASPQDDYAYSKWEAEQGLRALCGESSMELVIIRPPLIYGPGVKGNLALLCNAIDKGLPLPLGAIRNERDMLSLNNLTDLIKTCIDHPKAAEQVFLCSDNEAVSTPQLVRMMADARNTSAHLWRIPVRPLKLFTQLVGKQAMFQRLSDDFKIDIQHTMDTLDWKPPFSVEQSMQWAFSKKA